MGRKKKAGRPAAADGGAAPVGGTDAAVVVTFRMSRKGRDAVKAAAKRAKLEPSEWWRRLAEAALSLD